MDQLKMFCVILLCITPMSDSKSIPIGMFRTECQDRHFWLAVRSNVLGHTFRFDVEDSHGVHTITGAWAAECGYTVVRDPLGDLVLRASYLACHVENQVDTEYQLLVWFVNVDGESEETSYPLLLTCPLQQPWSPREMVCEETYMEVSVLKPTPPDHQKGTEWMNPAPVNEEEGLSEWRVVFRVPVINQELGEAQGMREETVPVEMAHLMGYHVNSTGSRILLRCPYGSRLSYPIQVNGIEMEMVSATVLYKHQWMLLRVDTSVACTTRKASLDLEGRHIVWSAPHTASPLLQPPVTDSGFRVGVGGQYLSPCMAKQHSYQMRELNGTVQIQVPFGAQGGLVKSHVSDGEYFQSYFLDLFFLQEWEDAQWSLTQQRSFRPTSIPHQLQTPRVINSTNASEGMFSVALGLFPSDVSLVNIIVGGETVSLSQAERLGLSLSQVPFPNGTHLFLLQAPFSHPAVTQQYLGERRRRYSLSVVFTLMVSPEGDLYHHLASVETHLEDVVLPSLEGECMPRGIKLLLHYGNMDTDWAMYVGGQRLDWELVQVEGYSLEAKRDQFGVDVPLYSQGMTYEGLGLEGLLVSVHLRLSHSDTGENITYRHRCLFPVPELLVCLPDERVIVLVDTSSAFPPIDPQWTSLLNPSCRPVHTNNTQALFSFKIDACGTLKTEKNGELHYMNEVRYTPVFDGRMTPPTTSQLSFRIPVGCVHPVKGPPTLTIYEPQDNTPSPASYHSRKVRRAPAWPNGTGTEGYWRRPLLRGRKNRTIETGG
ncbi:uncharacterized protein LOC134452774 [Engraulis encrasicolus]|uniref:uncharacterized protein LOC134452774 n=1 Tax=Engraulis encrasicolus TaxID=184585 RepID=UPI002FCEC996